MKKSFNNKTLQVVLLLIVLFFTACRPLLFKEADRPEQALVPVRWSPPFFDDDMDKDSLLKALDANLRFLSKLRPDHDFAYGPDRYTCRQVMESQSAFLELLRITSGPKELNEKLEKEFLVYKAAGRDGRVLFTGYYEPIFPGRLHPDAAFRYPIHRKPDDLIKIDLSPFHEEYKGKTIIARIDRKSVVPYYSRKQITQGSALGGRHLELAWLKDPVDVAFLQIQGSGQLDLGDGRAIRVGYSETNGRPYRSIGRYLMERGLISREEMSMQAIRRVLARRPEIVEEVLNSNPRYVFFRDLGDSPLLGSMNIPLTPGRTIALDPRVFPPGAMAWIKASKPIVNERGEIVSWETFTRFVTVQDTGDAIKGPARADLFWGSGSYAELAAGHMQHEGELYILIKRPGV